MKNITKSIRTFRNFFKRPVAVAPAPTIDIDTRDESSDGRYSEKRTLRRWSTPQLIAAKCLLRYHKFKGTRFHEVYDQFNKILPWLAEHYEQLHGAPLTRNVVHQRFNTTKAKVHSWPRNHVYWPVARVLARLAGPISESRLLALIHQLARK